MAMQDMREISERVLTFLLNWRAERDNSLVFTLRRRPVDRLESGLWFLGNKYYLLFSCWTGLDTQTRRQNIHIEISIDGKLSLRFVANDDKDKAEVLRETAIAMGGFFQLKKQNIWVKEYEGTDYLSNLELFLLEDKPRIDTLLSIQRRTSYRSAFERALNPLDPVFFNTQLDEVQRYRQAPERATSREKSQEVKPLIVTRLELENVGMFEHCAIELGERATCLIGENGGGKTTLLRALALGLIGTGSPLIDTEELSQQLPRIVGVDDQYRFLYAGKGSIRVAYTFGGLRFENGRANTIRFQPLPDLGKVIFEGDMIQDDGFGLPTGDTGADGDGELPVLVIGYPQRYGKKSDGTNIRKRTAVPHAYDVLPLITDTEDNRIDSLRLWISENWNQGGKHRRKVEDMFQIVSAILDVGEEGEMHIRIKSAVSHRKIVVTTPFNPDGIPLELLSTGLSNLFGWIGYLVGRMHEAYTTSEYPVGEPAVVLIDEIDNYLHPLTQVRTIQVLLKAFPQVQFVFTSHSPVVLAALDNQQVRAYRVEQGQVYEIPYFYGRTVQDLLRDEYGVDKRPAQSVQAKIDEMLKALALNKKAQAYTLLSELLPVLGEADPAIRDARYALR